MAQQMLVITESRFMRRVIQNYTMAEMGEFVVHTAGSSTEGRRMIETMVFDVIISALELAGSDGIKLRDWAANNEANRHTPFILMTSTKTQAQKERLAHHKVRHHLFAPFTKDEFARIIAYAVNDREKRLCPRYRVRGTAAVLHFGDREVPARVVNLSKCGVLVEQACSGRYSECLEDARIDLMFASEYGGGRVSGLMTTVRRVDVVTWQEDLGPELVRSARRFVHPSEEMKKAIQSVLDQVGQELLVYEDQIDEPF